MQQKRFLTLAVGLIGVLTLISLYSCNKKNSPISEAPPAPVTDYDNNVYKTVKIGSQVWMVGALKVTHYNDGTTIPYVVNGSTWAATTTGARCYYGTNVGGATVSTSDSAKYAATYGALYNWYAVNTGKLAPKGYHVADTSDFNTLINYLGGPSIAGQFLKSAHNWVGDADSIYSSRNSTGFTALPAGFRSINGNFYGLGPDGYFWSSREDNSSNAYYQYLNFNSAGINRYNSSKLLGFSVACVRDLLEKVSLAPLYIFISGAFLIITITLIVISIINQMHSSPLVEDLFRAYFDARKNKRNTINALAFEKHFESNLFLH